MYMTPVSECDRERCLCTSMPGPPDPFVTSHGGSGGRDVARGAAVPALALAYASPRMRTHARLAAICCSIPPMTSIFLNRVRTGKAPSRAQLWRASLGAVCLSVIQDDSYVPVA